MTSFSILPVDRIKKYDMRNFKIGNFMLTREYVEKLKKSREIPTVNLKIFDSIYSLPFGQFVIDHENDSLIV